MIILDNLKYNTKSSEEKIFWNGYSKDYPNDYILSIIDNNAEDLRKKLLIITDKFFEIISDDPFQDKKDLLISQMSLFVERNIYKEDSFLNALKILALSEIIEKRSIKKITYVGTNKDIASSIKCLSKKKKIIFKWKNRTKISLNIKSILNIFSNNYLPAFALIFLFIFRYIFLHLKTGFKSKQVQYNISFFSYFFNIKLCKINEGKFYSEQWKLFPKIFNDKGIKLNWFHLFVKSSKVRNTIFASSYINILNRKNTNSEMHSLLEANINKIIIFKVIKHFLKILIFKRHNIKTCSEKFINDEHEYLWILFKRGWEKSNLGTILVNNLFYIYFFEDLLKNAPQQKIGFYLLENKGWERALIFFWRKYNHGKLIGVQHSTLNFWFMSYFDNPKNSLKSSFNKLPKPDIIAINGQHALQILKNANQKNDLFRKSEAIRYQYLLELKKRKKQNIKVKNENNILILGDIIQTNTERMLDIILPVIKEENSNYKVIFKAHPQNKIRLDNKFNSFVTVSESDLYELILETNLVICSGNTSSALECNYIGLNVISYLDNHNLNSSPLRGNKNVHFFSNKEDFIEILRKKVFNSINEKSEKNFFWLNSNMNLWKKILSDE